MYVDASACAGSLLSSSGSPQNLGILRRIIKQIEAHERYFMN